MENNVIHKIGRRKTAVARVYLSEGKGNITINKKDLANYYIQKEFFGKKVVQ